jgi:hypothetical protein
MSSYLDPVPHTDSRVEAAIAYFACNECAQWDGAVHYYYDPLDNLITWFPKQHLFHIHFGKPSWNEAITKEESQWVYDATQIGVEKGPIPMFVICDFSHIDDSEFPTKQSIRTYAKAVSRKESSTVASYGGTFAMQMVLKLIGSFNSTARKMSFAADHDDAMKQYAQWFEQHPEFKEEAQ